MPGPKARTRAPTQTNIPWRRIYYSFPIYYSFRAERRPPRGLPLKVETIFKSNIILVGRGPKAPGRTNAGRSGASPARENGPKARAGRVSGAEATPWDPTKSRTFFATVSNHAK
jgi:hypothetical protein